MEERIQMTFEKENPTKGNNHRESGSNHLK